ncbi:hypothetical protein QNI16_09490 [Cytophagaceae bacterium YF14B1]|uniref:HEAT repeat domain-containing protein n=1 Tax=Xanthocytophaga flava TaxID=3048013 RepID=A0AAE3QPG2_9BACT|nr:hypothetical protein [Xanthocytophaga flavus]MDJ1480716.1 hypothetical protein [Xanthocytophaga flavus]
MKGRYDFSHCTHILSDSTASIEQKLQCLDTYKEKGSIHHIGFLFPLLKSKFLKVPFLSVQPSEFQVKVANVIKHILQRQKITAGSYEFLRYLYILPADINKYKCSFPTESYHALLMLASMNCDGYVREAAVRELALTKQPEAIPYILLRLGDWVGQVRNAANSAIQSFKEEQFAYHLLHNMSLIEWLLKVGKVKYSAVHTELIQFLLSQEYTFEWHKQIQRIPDHARVIYIYHLLQSGKITPEIAHRILTDKSHLVRLALLKNIHLLEESLHKDLLKAFLYDTSSEVRSTALQRIGTFKNELRPDIWSLIADTSATVRQFARYELKNADVSFPQIYRQQIHRQHQLTGSLLGLSETGTKEDIGVCELYLQHESSSVQLASLIAISMLDAEVARKYALQFLSHPSSKLRKRSIEILAGYVNNDILTYARELFLSGNEIYRKTILLLFSKEGGWRVLGDLLTGLMDKDIIVQEQTWVYLDKWVRKASTLYAVADPVDLERARGIYQSFNTSKLEVTSQREQIWERLHFYLWRQI